MADESDEIAAGDNALYEDKYCKLKHSYLCLKKYYCPTAQDKKIELIDMADESDEIAAGDNALYEDKYCKLKHSYLCLKKYYCPTAQDKKIELSAIKAIYYKKQSLCADLLTTRNWGICALNFVFWNFDLTRKIGSDENYNVVIDTGSKIKKGFSVTDIETFLKTIRPLLGPDIFIENMLPF
uniref:Uncharacterized protein n=1 Tax=Acrobeloides nanus TaxID=290746 RepID=A0A914D3J8_9BILA